jgi:hypothetical protein
MHRSAVVLALAVAVSCRPISVSTDLQTAPPLADRRVIEAAVTDSFFGAITRFDFTSLRRSVTPGFELVEDTLRLDVNGFVSLLRGLEGKATVRYRFADFNTHVLGNTAWTSYRNYGDFVLENQPLKYEWLETAVLVRANGVWRIDRLHSTRLPVESRSR